MKSDTLRVIRVVDGTSVDGPGLRTSIYLAGCDHHCPGCHNPATWPHTVGEDVTIDDIVKHVIDNEFDVTLTGGDPLYQPQGVKTLVNKLKQMNINVWLYTGFTYEEIMADPKLSDAIAEVDVVVDGPFIQSLRDETLMFRGSSNQRLIDNTNSGHDHIALYHYNPQI
ncbi:MAG: anaerobic ribonucleoside-triphosphate reductase activating protein [Muribaculaceae bacterium]|nr:anaerobic ribonucleoside-triphosphate reductase activating protein [Muribaculaceae bacterium]